MSRGEDSVTIKDAAILIPAGEGKLAFAPWCPYSNAADGVEISNQHVMFVAEAQSELEQQYVSAITGLVVPEKGKIQTAGSPIAGADLKLTT